jgi:hypothetical protein
MVTCIRSLYYKTPTDELAELILSLNQLLAESETSYNQRMAQKKKEEGEEEEDAGNSDSSENSGDPEATEPSDSSEQ